MKIPVGIFSLHLNRDIFDTCLITLLIVHDLRLPAAAFDIAQIHTHEHRCPVAGLRTACTGMDVHEAIGSVMFSTESAADFKILQVLFQFPVFVFELGGMFILAFRELQ